MHQPLRIVHLIAFCLMGISFFLGVRSAQADPLDTYGFGTRAIGMGGAFTGLADDYSAVFYNPAGMAYTEDTHLAFGYITARDYFDLNLEPAPGTSKREANDLNKLERRRTNIDDTNGYYVGFTSRLNKYLALGMLAYLPTDVVIRLHPIDTHLPSFIMYENRVKRGETYVGFSFMPIPAFSVGGGVSIFANSKGTFSIPVKMEGGDLTSQTNSEAQKLDIPSDLTLDFPFSYTPYAGVMVRPFEWLRLGASYRGSFQWDVTVDVRARLDLENYTINLSELDQIAPGLLPLKGTVEIRAPALGNRVLRVPLELDGLDGSLVVNASLPIRVVADMSDHWKPQEAAFGASAKIGDAWTLTSDVTWYDWSEYPAPDLRLTVDDFTVKLSTLPTTLQARLRTLSVPIIGTVGPLPPVQVAVPGLRTALKLRLPSKAIIKPRTHDIFVPRLGVEHHFSPISGVLWVQEMQFAARAGYSYQPSPFEPERGYVNLVDTDKHVASVGAGVTFNRNLSLDAYGQYHYLVPIRIEKDLVDSDYPFDAIEASGYVLSTGVSMSYRW
ncbi:MAG: hypothetical protein GX444_19150 [Myxococcales bacterium]|nr:hypothetical protein [Myxococcales bacterium]